MSMAALLCLASTALAKPAQDKPLPSSDPRVRDAREPPADARDAIARALEFTVTIEGDGVYGSGILVAPAAGKIVTAYHVIADVRAPRVTFHDGRTEIARIVESDRVLDVALLEVAPRPGRAPLLGDATAMRAGDEVFAIGCPRRLGFTVSRGIVSYVGRYMDGARYLQTDLPINDGNSGGPVVDRRGELVGMMSFVLRRAQGIAFALPANYLPERFAPLRSLPAEADYLERFRRWHREAAGIGSDSLRAAGGEL